MSFDDGQELPAEERRRIYQDLAKNSRHLELAEKCKIHSRELPFYSKHRLITVRPDLAAAAPRRFLYDGIEFTEVTPNMDAVYAINVKNGITIDRTTALDYARFLLGTHCDRRPRAMLLESWADVAWAFETPAERRQEARRSVMMKYDELKDEGVDFPGEPINAPEYRGFSLLQDLYGVRAYLQINDSISIATVNIAPYETLAKDEAGELAELRPGEIQLRDLLALVSMDELSDGADRGARAEEDADVGLT